LIETIAFYFNNEGNNGNLLDLGTMVGTDMLIFDLIIGNKVVMKDTPIFVGGGPSTFATMGSVFDSGPGVTVSVPRHQIFLEGAGILIPPQVEWSINYSAYSWATGVKTDLTTIPGIAAYLFGTRVLLNFNTSI